MPERLSRPAVALIFAAIGLASLIGMLIFTQRSKRWKDLDV